MSLTPLQRAFTLISTFLLLTIFAATWWAQSIGLTVKEKSCLLNFDEEKVKAVLAVENNSSNLLPAQVKLELIDQKDRVRYFSAREDTLKSGASTLSFDFTKTEIKDVAISDDKLWWRLRYEITPQGNAAAVQGIISASAITPDIFDLQVFASIDAYAGTKYQARVRTVHPLTGNPVNNVNITALTKYTEKEKEHTSKVTAKTNQDGYAVLTFDLPKDIDEDDDDFEIEFTAKKGSLEREEALSLNLLQTDTYLVTTDKNLYQPGQTIHTRVVLFNQQKQARADYEMEAKIEDSDEENVYRTKIKTSKFGVASFDWEIPESTKLGGYKIKIGIQTPRRIWGEANVKISRYDLPNFAVKTKSDKTYYLPNENAEVEIKADYLFGQPVTKGSVKVVREADRNWNNKTYKYDVEEGETYRGEIDASGKFIAKVDLKELHEKFEDSDYRKFEDVHFAAYVTDATTGRTEQRKFDLRLTKKPIHLYFIKEQNYAPNELINAYVNASYADGSPAQCDVEIFQKIESDDKDKEDELKLLTRVSTNKYGLAKVTGLQRIKADDDDSNDCELVMQAKDTQGKTGKADSEINIYDEPTIRVSTDKALYHAGEAIQATIKCSVPTTHAVLEILQAGRVVNSQLVDVRDGVANVNIPYKGELKDDVTLVAYANVFDEEDDEVKFIYASRAILFPHDRELKLAVKFSRNEYQPGEEAHAELLVKSADGKPVNSALGAMIVDTAVGERERTDNEFRGSNGYGNYYGYYYGDANIAGLTRRDFDQLDLKKPIPDGYDLAAEVMLQNGSRSRIDNHHDSEYRTNQQQIFSAWFTEQFRRLKQQLEFEYANNAAYPRSINALKFMLHRIDLDPEELRDPWGTPYRFNFETNRGHDEMTIYCAGADKQFDTGDDFTAFNISRLYFKFIGEAVNRAVANYQAQSGDYVRDTATLKNELKREGLDLDALRDPWGTPYQIRLQKQSDDFYLIVESAGRNKKIDPKHVYGSDDFEVWRARITYFTELRYQIEKALNSFEKSKGKFPGDEATFRLALKNANINFDNLHDPLGHGFYAVIAENSYYTNRAETVTYTKFGEKPIDRTELIPITQKRISINVRGLGEDGKDGTPDDFSVAQFSRVTEEQSSREATPVQKTQVATEEKKEEKKISSSTLAPGFGGTITGAVTDASGAVVPNAKIVASQEASNLQYSATSNSEGLYFLRGLPPNVYRVTIDAAGFKRAIYIDVSVSASKTTLLNFTLEVGQVNETVAITAETIQLQTSSSSTVITEKQLQSLPINGRNSMSLVKIAPGIVGQDISTPRLREYFPETLLWQPNIETDKQGRAQLKFKLADNITTWKLSLIGSTVDGQIGTVEKDIRAFQPFFAELDPPKILTEGDEISLPVVLRNYLDKPQSVDVQFKPESWFTMLSPARKKSEVKANDSTNEIFNFRAIASINKGKQRVTAIASAASDAIEKTVNVHPDGEEIAETAAGVFNESGTLELNLPKESITGSVRGELKIYPNLLAHVTEGIEGILQRPHGCGEQTISSTYPNVMALRLLKSSGIEKNPIEKTARKYTQAGYDRLLGYRDASGGFTYWGKGEPDLALTAYALRFLNDADEVIDVKGDVIVDAEKWLFKQQRNDGHWSVNDYYKSTEDTRRSTMYTALIARAVTSGGAVSKEYSINLERAFVYLEKEMKAYMEPYSLANYVIAAQQAGLAERAKWAIEELRKSPQPEAGGNYWALETNTPFYGWGLAGRIETTALVIKALGKSDRETGGIGDEAISKGVFWLLRNKDRYGVWLSTQATINVLDAFISLNDSSKNSAESSAEIFVNGSRATSVTMPPSKELVSPITVDLSKFLTKGKNTIEIKRPSNAALASMQVVETYYLPWSASMATQAENFKAGAKRALRLAVTYDKTEAKIGEEITCKVEAERIGFSGYGMMLAEVGLPPGVDVDRASLEAAVKEEGWGINHYEVLPDRIILYLWPRAGGTKFNFKFKSRYGFNAMNAASILYDYYNPEARAVVVPEKFVVK